MSFEFTDIDHLMLRVTDLDRACAAFSRLGFTVAPPRRPFDPGAVADAAGHSHPSAADSRPIIDNRLILFQPFPGRTDVGNFLELMHLVDPDRTPPAVTQMLSFLLDSEGPKSVVCHTRSVRQAREALVRAGIEVAQPVALESAWWDEQAGTAIPVRASPAAPVTGQLPFQFIPYETDTVESYRHPPWTEHPNGARYMAGITGVTERIDQHAAVLARTVFNAPVQWQSDDIAILRTRDLFFRIVTPRGFAELYPGLDFSSERTLPHIAGATIAVDRISLVSEVLSGNDVPYRESRDGLAVPRQYAGNTVLDFVPLP